MAFEGIARIEKNERNSTQIAIVWISRNCLVLERHVPIPLQIAKMIKQKTTKLKLKHKSSNLNLNENAASWMPICSTAKKIHREKYHTTQCSQEYI